MLEALAGRHLFFDLDPSRPGHLPPLAAIGLLRSPRPAEERATMRRLGLASLARWSPAERHAWSRFAPWVASLRGLERWSSDERRRVAAGHPCQGRAS
jgi:hypothetical protein